MTSSHERAGDWCDTSRIVGTAAVGGFHVAALVKMGWQQEAEEMLHALAAANRLGVREEWEFNEWLPGETGHPMGYAYQSWSAGMYLYAYHAVVTGETPLFDALGVEKGGEE